MSKNNSSNTTTGGIGFTGALSLIFITLKLLNVIDWSWVWVLSPLWISLAIFLLCVIGLIIFYAIKSFIRKRGKKK